MCFDYCLFPLRYEISYARALAYAVDDNEATYDLDILYWLLNNGYGVIQLAGVTFSPFPWRGTSLEDFIF